MNGIKDLSVNLNVISPENDNCFFGYYDLSGACFRIIFYYGNVCNMADGPKCAIGKYCNGLVTSYGIYDLQLAGFLRKYVGVGFC